MRLDERKFPDLLRRARQFRVILLHGDDPVLVAERAAAVVRGLLADGAGPFGAMVFEGPEHVRAVDELQSPMLGGSGAVVRLRDAGDAAAASLERALAGVSGGVLVVEAGGLTARSRVRTLMERSDGAAAMLLRGTDARDMATAVDHALQERGVRIEADARALLVSLAKGHGAVLADAEKLALLVAERGLARLGDVQELGQDGAGAAFDEVAYAVSLGSRAASDRAVEWLLSDGVAPVAILRTLLTHMARVRSARIAVDLGAGIGEAVGRWRAGALDAVCAHLWRADLQSRQTGAPAVSLCREAVAMLAEGA